MVGKPQVLAHLRQAQLTAAQTAIEQFSSKRGTAPTEENVAAWVKALWHDIGTGVVDPAAAQKALEAFSDRAPPAQAPVLGAMTLKPGAGGVALRSAQLDDGKDWKAGIDLSAVDARVVALEADIDWVLSLDLREPEQYKQFGAWAGWTVKPEHYENGASWSDFTVRGVFTNAIARRHSVPAALTDSLMGDKLNDDGSQRWRASKAFIGAAAEHARGAFEREAKLDAFLHGLPQIKDRIRGGRAEASDVRHELEDQLGLPRDTIRPGELDMFMDEIGWRRDGQTDEQHVDERKQMGHIQQFFIGHVRGSVTANRMADTLIATGLDKKLASGGISDDDALAQIAELYGVPADGISLRAFAEAKDLAPRFLAAYG